MGKKIYLLEGEMHLAAGVRKWVVGAYSRRKTANAHKELAQGFATQVEAAAKRGSFVFVNPYDHQMTNEKGHVIYRVLEKKLSHFVPRFAPPFLAEMTS